MIREMTDIETFEMFDFDASKVYPDCGVKPGTSLYTVNRRREALTPLMDGEVDAQWWESKVLRDDRVDELAALYSLCSADEVSPFDEGWVPDPPLMMLAMREKPLIRTKTKKRKKS